MEAKFEFEVDVEGSADMMVLSEGTVKGWMDGDERMMGRSQVGI